MAVLGGGSGATVVEVGAAVIAVGAAVVVVLSSGDGGRSATVVGANGSASSMSEAALGRLDANRTVTAASYRPVGFPHQYDEVEEVVVWITKEDAPCCLARALPDGRPVIGFCSDACVRRPQHRAPRPVADVLELFVVEEPC